MLSDFAAEFHFVHGLYLTLASRRLDDENAAREVAAEMCADLKRRGLPMRHAGSFGFDFAAAEWDQDRARSLCGQTGRRRFANPNMGRDCRRSCRLVVRSRKPIARCLRRH